MNLRHDVSDKALRIACCPLALTTFTAFTAGMFASCPVVVQNTGNRIMQGLLLTGHSNNCTHAQPMLPGASLACVVKR
jgi:hypothetical protein